MPSNGVREVRAEVGREQLAAILSDEPVDVVFHLANAAYVPPSLDDPRGDLLQNAGTTLDVLEAVRRTPSPPLVVFASSAAVYGEGRDLPIAEDHRLEPVSPYGISKLAAEQYVRMYAAIHGCPTLAARLFSVYGPGQHKQVVHDLLLRIINGENPLRVLGRSEAERDLIYVDDVATALVVLGQRGAGRGEAYNVASGRPVSIADLVTTMLRLLGKHVEVRFDGRTRPGDPLRWEADTGRAQALGVVATTTLEEGLRRTAEWLRDGRGQPSAGRGAER